MRFHHFLFSYFAVIFIISLISGCSLDYFTHDEEEKVLPEFVFYDVSFTRLENNKNSTEMTMGQLEQYSEEAFSAGKEAQFILYNESGGVSVLGQCDLMSMDTEKDEYYFFGNVAITSHDHNAQITADNLRWIGSEEEFSAGLDDVVRISVGDIEGDNEKITGTSLFVEGTGFSASGIDFSYSFDGPVSGRIIEN